MQMLWTRTFAPGKVAKTLGSVNTTALLGLCIAAIAYGCGDGASAPVAPVALVEHGAWRAVDADDDPFDDRPAMVSCSTVAFGLEDLGGEPSLGVRTGECDYLSAMQPSLVDIREGDPLNVRVFHFELTNPTPAKGHVAIAIGERTVWQQTVTIPSDGSALLIAEPTAPADAPAGTPIYFHVHNHGLNAWNLIELSTLR